MQYVGMVPKAGGIWKVFSEKSGELPLGKWGRSPFVVRPHFLLDALQDKVAQSVIAGRCAKEGGPSRAGGVKVP
ncbi:hypothetical protein QFZ97_007010 [Paraburkholderia youngii]